MTTLLAYTLLAAPAAPSIQEYVQPNLRDATFVARVVKGDQRELKKINKDFGSSYRFDTVNIRAEEPFKLRLESIVDDTSIVYIVNADKALYYVPKLRVRKTVDLSDSPGRRQTFFDFGILTPSLFKSFLDADFVRMDRATGDAVFDVKYGGQSGKTLHERDDTRFRIWIDPERKIVSKREWYNQRGQLIATFFYENPTKDNGVWMPTQLTVKNNDGNVAGVTKYVSIKVNTGISDESFTTK